MAPLEKPSIKPHEMKLWLPSSLEPSAPCDPNLKVYEWRLRHAQAKKALSEVRQAFRLRSHLLKQKKRFVRGVAHNTRANSSIQKVQDRAMKSAHRYRTAYAALLILSPQVGDVCPTNWRDNLRPLLDQDLRGISEGLDGESEGKRSISWIWRVEDGSLASKEQKTHEGTYLMIS